MFLIAAALLLQPAAEPPTDWDKEFGVEEKQRDPVTGPRGRCPAAPPTDQLLGMTVRCPALVPLYVVAAPGVV